MRLVYISGVHSGPNPSPGVGVARSLRLAYPGARLVAVDYSAASSGLHSDVFDDVWLQRPWSEIDFATYADDVREVLGAGALWISGLDLETIWLSRLNPCPAGVLVPEGRSFARLAKPHFRAARDALPLSIPAYLALDQPQEALHAFCRRTGWKVWVKGPQYEARRVANWHEFTRAVDAMAATWGAGDLFLQEHVAGVEESIAFCAYRGRLLDCVVMRKRAQTSEGKTWAGHVDEVSAQTRRQLVTLLDWAGWSGGGELEFVRGTHGLSLIDLNPRFPAWIYGATLAGRNLPAQLAQAAGWGRGLPTDVRGQDFTRIVVEIATRPGLPLPTILLADEVPTPGGKHPSGMPALSRRLAALQPPGRPADEELREVIAADLDAEGVATGATPRRVLLARTLKRRFAEMTGTGAGSVGSGLLLAYSAKTSPDPCILQRVEREGWLLEVIGEGEIAAGLRAGFAPERLVYNGPVPLLPERLPGRLGAYFCDSLESLQTIVEHGRVPARVLGVRVRPPRVHSRFGIDLAAPDHFIRLTELLSKLPQGHPLGIHFHVSGDGMGFGHWRALFTSVLGWARLLEEECGRPLSLLDAGGGFTPREWDEEVCPALGALQSEAFSQLRGLKSLILEPGKALAQGVMALVTEVCEIRHCPNGALNVVVDTAVSELPMAGMFPHPVCAQAPNGRWRMLGRGTGRLLGRTCMENDVLACDIHIPSWLDSGCRLVFLDAGAYDASMAFPFGGGHSYA